MSIIKLCYSGHIKNGWFDAETREIGLPKDLLNSGEGRVIERNGDNMTLSVRDDSASLFPTGTYDPKGHYQFAPKTPGLDNKIYIPIGIDPREQVINEEFPIIVASTLAPRLILVPVNGRELQKVLMDGFANFVPNCEFEVDFLDPRTLQPDRRHIEIMNYKGKYKLNYTRFIETIERVRHSSGVLGRLNLAQVKGKWVSVTSSGIIEKVHDKNPIVTWDDGPLGFGTIKKTVDGTIVVYTSNDRLTVFSQNGEQLRVIEGVNKLFMHDMGKLRSIVNEAEKR